MFNDLVLEFQRLSQNSLIPEAKLKLNKTVKVFKHQDEEKNCHDRHKYDLHIFCI